MEGNNKIAKEYTKHIPTGDSLEDVYKRNEIIIECLLPLIGKSVKCKAYRNNVEFVFKSIDETATRAAKTYESTLAALRIEEALRDAVIVRKGKPESNNQKKMGFIKIHVLKSFLKNIGEVKIVIGERKKQKVIHYCITKKIRPTKNI